MFKGVYESRFIVLVLNQFSDGYLKTAPNIARAFSF
jgi:hypothetical protein